MTNNKIEKLNEESLEEVVGGGSRIVSEFLDLRDLAMGCEKLESRRPEASVCEKANYSPDTSLR